MTTFAVSNAVALYTSTETVWNEVPSSPQMRQVRFTGESLVYGKKTVESETIRSDRMRDAMNLVSFETKGDFNFELNFFDNEGLMEGALFSNFVATHTKTATTLALTGTQLTDSGNGLASFPANSYIWLTGATNPYNNIRYLVTASAAGALTLSPPPFATQSSGPSMTINGDAITVTVSASITVTVAGSTVTFGGGTGFNPSTATNWVAGQWVQFAGFLNAGNNGLMRIVSVGATTVVVSQSLTGESVANTTVLTFNGRMLRNGTTQKSFLIQKAFTDINQFLAFRGMTVSDMKWDLQSSAIVKGSFAFMGGKVTRAATTYAGNTLATNTTPTMTSSTSVGSILQNGSAFPAGIKAVQLAVNNNLRASEQLGQTYPLAIGYGFADVTGQVEVYFQDGTLYDELVNNTTSELVVPMTDSAGNTYVLTIPSVVFTEGFPSAAAGNQDVMIPLSWHAVRNATYNCEIQIDQIPAV